jgi:EAL domain-containing protein (putative c-di-GMP-specific phosphodiesterase class I)
MTQTIPSADQCVPFFQPIIDIPTGAISGYECLARHIDENGKAVSAGWVFESSGLPAEECLKLDRSIRNKALDRFNAEQDEGLLFINISPLWINAIKKGEVPPSLRMIQQIGIDPQRVVLEITEGFGDSALLEDLVKLYREAGVKIAIDDFGVGGSQVDRLIALKPEYLKIDMGIFKAAARGGESANILLSLANVADRSGCEILCEGIESEQEYHFALECGARKLQGWLFSPANAEFLEHDEFSPLVKQYQASFLERKKNQIINATKANQAIDMAVMNVVDAITHDKLDELNARSLRSIGIARAFICDLTGNQLSENIEFGKDGAVKIPMPKQVNWSHRPYFAELLALNKEMSMRQVVSKPYIDRNEKKMCKTRGIVINQNRILCVDTLVDDDVLFCR